MQTIANPDGTVSIIHVDPNNPVITLPDGTTAQVQGVAQMDPGQGVHTLAEVASQHSSLEVGQTSTGELHENGHIIITSDDGSGKYCLFISYVFCKAVEALGTLMTFYLSLTFKITKLVGRGEIDPLSNA